FFATSPDLCADVYVDANGQPLTDAAGQTISRYCQPAGPDAPVFDAHACCTIDGDQAACVLPNAKGRGSRGSTRRYCEYGEATRAGVNCYQPFDSACDHGFCVTVQPPDLGPIEDAVCCFGDGGCIEIENGDDVFTCFAGQGWLFWCDNGAQNADGTVDCFD